MSQTANQTIFSLPGIGGTKGGSMSNTASLYEVCSELVGGSDSLSQFGQEYNTLQVLQCVTNNLEKTTSLNNEAITSWIFILTGALVFVMQVGFAMLCAGCVRKKNVQNTMLKNLLDACGAAAAFYTVGYAFAFGGQNTVVGTTFLGWQDFFLITSGDEPPVDPAYWFFEFAFAATSVTIVAGTLAERCQMAAYLCYSVFLTGFVYPVVAHAVWSNNGFLGTGNPTPVLPFGAIDFAGSGVVHLTGGTTSLIATYILGARKGRFTDSRGRKLAEPRPIVGHSMALQMLGTMILWFGWYGFNCGSALTYSNGAKEPGAVGAVAAANTSLAAACGALSALFTNLYFHERKTGEYNFDLTMAMNGSLGGLVAITAPCGTVEHWAGCLIGIVAGWIYFGGSKLIVYLRLDDAVDAIPVHMFCGMWGLLACGLFSSPGRTLAGFGQDQHVGWFYSLGRGSSDATLLVNQVIFMLFIMGWVTVTMLPFFTWLNYMGWFRSDSLEELVGLDMSYHGGAHNGGEPDIKAEYIKAYNRKKIEHRRRAAGGETEMDEASWTDLTTGGGLPSGMDAYSVASAKSGVSNASSDVS